MIPKLQLDDEREDGYTNLTFPCKICNKIVKYRKDRNLLYAVRLCGECKYRTIRFLKVCDVEKLLRSNHLKREINARK